MTTLKSKLLTTVAVMPLAFATLGAATMVAPETVATQSVAGSHKASENPCAAKKPCNPCAAKACNPCAAKACNPCAAKACNPCAAKACNPCAAKACNPCAAKACNPCAAKACNPCAATNPCAAKNPCAASACGACNPCGPCGAASAAATTQCYVPRIKAAFACNPCAIKPAKAGGCGACNPCAAKACNPCAAKACNPCAAKPACGACNPCAAKKACNPCAATNPCAAKNPCAASACGACNPCAAGGGGAADPDDLALTPAEGNALYDCLQKTLEASWKTGGHWAVKKWAKFERFSKYPHPSATHGNRYVVHYTNKIGAAAYGKYSEDITLPVGTTTAKPSFTVGANGQASIGPLFIMEKMVKGFNSATADWRYAMIMPGGTNVGITGGKGSAALKFCHDCHEGVAEQDYMFYPPEDEQVK